jgi:hypothetical protein
MPLTTIELISRAIAESGGGPNALEYAKDLTAKTQTLEATKRYPELIKQLLASKDEGDLLGRVLEVHIADAFEGAGIALSYESSQGMNGNVDFSLRLANHLVFIEAKLRTQDRETRASIDRQLRESGVYAQFLADDTADIARMQIDMLQKSSTKKFNPVPDANWVNLVAIDISELQLGAVDLCDCLIAAAGNSSAAEHCDRATLRPTVLGFFEAPTNADHEVEWLRRVHAPPADDAHHPREYIHGIWFLFRKPTARAVLSYNLTGPIVWNRWLVAKETVGVLSRALHAAIPFHQD